MILKNLVLQNFRSYKKTSFVFSPKTTLIVGANAAGKTNILEAIMLLATGKSFRADIDAEMIRWGDPFARVNASVGDTKLEVLVTPTKKYLVNGVAKRQIDFVGHLHSVLFWPEDLRVVTDSPSIRRKYVDMVLVQIDREYRRNLISYERGVRQRNRLLDMIREGKANRSQLLFWNQLLIKAGGYITDSRSTFFAFLNTFAVVGIQYEIVYNKSVISENRLEQYRDEEVAAKATLVGPHRDDFSIFQDHHEVSKYGSRGEQRLAVLWLKLGELTYIERAVGSRPLLLLDDIFSELDDEHRAIVGAVMSQQQTIITSAERDILGQISTKNVTCIKL